MASAIINLSVDADLKAEVDNLFADIGLTTNDAIRMFLKQSLLYNGLPLVTQRQMQERKRPEADPNVFHLTKRGTEQLNELLENSEKHFAKVEALLDTIRDIPRDDA